MKKKLKLLFMGPVEVQKRLGLSTYLVKMGKNTNKYGVYNIANLYPYVNRTSIKDEMKVVGELKLIKEENEDIYKTENCDEFY